MSEFGTTFLKQVADKVGLAEGSPGSSPIIKAPTFGEALETMCPSGKSMEILSKTMGKWKKDLATVDITPLRLVSLVDGIQERINEDTVFLNLLELRGDYVPVDDYQMRIREEDSDDHATEFNVDAHELPAVKQTQYSARYNTVEAVGDTVMISMMAQQIMNKQDPSVNLRERQIRNRMNAIRRTMDRLLLLNDEQNNESWFNVPKSGGLINRSILNNFDLGNANFTEADIQDAVNAIRIAFGAGKRLIMMVDATQSSVIEDFMIDRYPGTDPITHMDSQRLLLNMNNYAVPIDTVYKPRPGLPIPIIVNDQLPPNTAVMFILDLVRLGRFLWDGQVGPYALVRPNATLYELVLIFDLFTLYDPLVISRAIFTNVGPVV